MSRNQQLEDSSIEYQPDAVALANQRLPAWARYGLVWVGVFFAGVLAWACFSQMEVIVEGVGKIVSEEPVITMKPLERTVIEKINVKFGERVKEKQILITFNPTSAKSDEQRLIRDRSAYAAQAERLRCEFENKGYKPSNNNDTDSMRQYALFTQRALFFKEKLNYHDGSIKRIEAALRSNKAALTNMEAQMDALNEIVGIYENLKKKDITSAKEFLQVRISQLQMVAGVDKLRNSLDEQEHEKESLIAARNSFVQEWQKDISEQLIKTEKDLNDTERMLEKAKMLASYVELRAPMDAMVHDIATFSRGSAVQEAEPLITLIPINCTMYLDAEIPTKDIGKIKTGDKVRIKLTAFQYQKHGTLDGEIVSISEDVFSRNGQSGLYDEVGKASLNTYYRARIKISGKLRNVTSDFRLIPGMEAQAEIKVGKRRVIEYLIYPLIKALDEAGREP